MDTTRSLLNKNKEDLAKTSTKTDENKSRDRSRMINETPNSELSKQIIAESVVNCMPESWSIEQVAQWLSSIHLEEYIEAFTKSEIDGSLLMNDGLDETLLKELIPSIKCRIIFNGERKELRSRQQQKSTMSTANTNDTHVTLKPTETSKMELLSSENNNQYKTVSVGVEQDMTNSECCSSGNRKLALIIGNSNYHRPNNRLSHIIENVRILSDSLKAIDFQVTTAYNVTEYEMTTYIINFSKLINKGDLVLFYFGGHGYQIEDKNYLIPIDDADVEEDEDIGDFAIDFEQQILEHLVSRTRPFVNIFILDCCGTYSLSSTDTSYFMSNNKGLHEIQPIQGAFIQFACAANEGVQDNLFTKHLLKNITKQNIDILELFRWIAQDVQRESRNRQRPLSINGLYHYQNVFLNEVILPVQIWDEVRQDEVQPILKKQEELRACYDTYPDIDDIVNRERLDIKNAEELTRSILSKSLSGNAAEMDTMCHVINNLIGNGNQGCLFFDSRQGVNLHDATANLADLSVTDRPLVLKLNNSDDFIDDKDSIKDEQYDIKLVKTLNRAIEQKQSHPVIENILERLSKAHNIDKKYIVLNNVYMGSFNIVYTIMDLATNIFKRLTGLSQRLKEQFKQFKAAKIHPLLYRPSFDISQFDARGNKNFSSKEGTFEVGPPGRKKSYIQPTGWTRYGLNVLGRYPNDKWLDPFDDPGNWYRAFHGTENAKAVDFSNSNASFDAQYASVDAAASIHKSGFREARTTVYGPGIYCSPKPSFVEKSYAGMAKLDTKNGTKTFKMMLQVAINPDGVKFANEDIWVAQNAQDIRTYGILIKEIVT